MENRKRVYPFTAIVGQEKMKTALLLNIINPLLGGVLIRGEKGTAKSTAVRALVDLLPQREQVQDCLYSCDPKDKGNLCANCLEKINKGLPLTSVAGKMSVVDLPVSATEDRVVGTLDLEYAIKKGQKKFEPGILAYANRNILYVDEVNLLEDHLVDVLLDSAAMGVNSIEREGVSFVHPAKFILVGTMNPEEGDLRPQLLDRFCMVVDVTGENNPLKRINVIKNRLEYEKDNDAFAKKCEREQNILKDKIDQAKKILNQVTFDEKILRVIAEIGIEMGVDGHRADIAIIKTAMTLAAFENRQQISNQDIMNASELVLPHRMRRTPFEEGVFDMSVVKKIIERTDKEQITEGSY